VFKSQFYVLLCSLSCSLDIVVNFRTLPYLQTQQLLAEAVSAVHKHTALRLAYKYS